MSEEKMNCETRYFIETPTLSLVSNLVAFSKCDMSLEFLEYYSERIKTV